MKEIKTRRVLYDIKNDGKTIIYEIYSENEEFTFDDKSDNQFETIDIDSYNSKMIIDVRKNKNFEKIGSFVYIKGNYNDITVIIPNVDEELLRRSPSAVQVTIMGSMNKVKIINNRIGLLVISGSDNIIEIPDCLNIFLDAVNSKPENGWNYSRVNNNKIICQKSTDLNLKYFGEFGAHMNNMLTILEDDGDLLAGDYSLVYPKSDYDGIIVGSRFYVLIMDENFWEKWQKRLDEVG